MHERLRSTQVGFGKASGSIETAVHSNGGARGSPGQHSARHAEASVHLLNANDGRWPLVKAARGAGRQDAGSFGAEAGRFGAEEPEPDGDMDPAGELRGQLARVAGSAAIVQPDIVLVRFCPSDVVCLDHLRPKSSKREHSSDASRTCNQQQKKPAAKEPQVWGLASVQPHLGLESLRPRKHEQKMLRKCTFTILRRCAARHSRLQASRHGCCASASCTTWAAWRPSPTRSCPGRCRSTATCRSALAPEREFRMRSALTASEQ